MKYQLLILSCLLLLPLVSAETNTFKQNEVVNYQFRCYDETGQYCNSATKLIANVEYPDGSNALNNVSMTYNETYFNVTLPTDKIGDNYKVLIHSPTSNNTVTEFPYRVTPSGFTGTLGFYILILVLSLGIIVLGFSISDGITVIFGSLGLYFVGLYIILNGIDGLKDASYTWGIGIIILLFASYISIRSAIELLD